ncbi:hypothetical protein OESDEN_05682 [Oesophagostomum dentatum]|uniref:Lysozyme n=1 Tax=Oesophagostomum dentatum TaxID=61180 RepID=A0A0B1TEY5_OESDE|nr:hypothetical protein OESDEN_05682 [Oesophagostomum dentatum]
MVSTFLLVSLFVACHAKAITNLAASSTYAYAVDLDKPVSLASFQCMKKAGYSTAFIRAYDPSGTGKFDANAVNNIRSANKAGLGTEVFMTPQPRSSKKGSTQIMELLEGLKKENIKATTVWVQVTSPVNWGSNVDNNIYFLNDIVSMAKYYSVRIGFYTSQYDWNQITKGASVQGPLLW